MPRQIIARRLGLCLGLLLLLLLSACRQAPSDEVRAYIYCIEAREAPAPGIAAEQTEPAWPLRRISQSRSPFAPPHSTPKRARRARPACRDCTGLAQFEPKELRILGTLANAKTTYALLGAPDRQIYRVQVGDRLGPAQARITRISASGIKLDHSSADQDQPRRYTYLQP